MIGICGLGGIGKTTLAMALYNELSPTFEGSCFLSNMRENEKEGLPSLEAKFMEEVLRGKMPIGNVREGVSLMKQRLGSKKVLLILDDVEHTRQLEAFTPNRREKVDWLGAGSKIIVTTRNKEVLIQHGLQEDAIYFPKGLDGEQSLQLFFRYAFVSDHLLAELDDLPQEIVEVAAGLPLALIIRDMGRMVVKEGGQFDDPLTYSRPWSKDQVLEVLKNPEDLWKNSGVQVLHLSRFYFEKVKMSRMGGGEMPKPSWKGIAAMPHLRMIIAGSEAAFDEHEKEIHLPGKIRWLSWDWCPHETVAFPDSRHEQLCILELHGGHFRDFRSPTLVLPKLKVLDLTWCGNLIRTPDFTHLPSLVKLVLHYCTSLIELDESIGHLSKLEKLIMEGCSKLKGLPAGLCKLTSLEFLDLFGCMQISVLPEQIGDLKSLKHLDLGRTGISYIPHSIGRLQCLEWLDLTGCSSLRTIPDRIGGLKNLSWLSLAECKLLEQLPNSMGTLTSLKELDIRNCESLIEVPDSLGDLNNDLKVFVEGCISLEILPNSIRMSGACFDELHLNGFKSLRRLPDSVADMRSVRWLSLRDCKSLQEIPVSIDRLESLEILDLSGCISLKKIPESVGNLKCLKCMSPKHCRSLEELPESMADLKSLEVLHISGGMSVKRVPDFIGKLKKVRELHLRGIEEMPNLISGLLRLEKFRVRDCPKLESLPRLSSSLTHLSVIGCKALPDLSGLDSLKSLQELVLVHGDGLGWKLMEKISQSSFERLKHLLIAGASEGSDLLFQLPKWQLLEQPIIVRLFCLVEEPPFNASQINVRIQVKVEGKIVTEGTWKARKAKDFDVPEKLEVEGKALYGVVLGNEEDEIFRCYVQQGRATFRVKATYKQYHLRMAYFYVKSPNLGLDYSVF
ncbi:Disease resistance protein [Nymphaea thermarum]|nr:Disease resistance protein [Nymphaea thermarum]